MGIHLKNNAVGLDKEINHLQEWLYDRLLNDFAWSDYECYGRAYLNKNPRVDGDKKNIFEVSVNGKDYAEITMDDRHAGSSFFYKKKAGVTDGGLSSATVILFFNLNLVKLLGQSNTRMDENAIIDILNVLHINPSSFQIGDIKTGTKDVYSEYNINVQDRDNMSEYMVCSIEMTVNFIHQYC